METMRFWGITPTTWYELPELDQIHMLTHYREHHLRESQRQQAIKALADEKKK